MSASAFVKANLGKRCFVQPSGCERRYGRIAGTSPYGTVVVEFEPYPAPGKVGQSQEWPVDRITLA